MEAVIGAKGAIERKIRLSKNSGTQITSEKSYCCEIPVELIIQRLV